MNKEKFIICKIKIFKKYFDISQNFFDICDIICMENAKKTQKANVLDIIRTKDGKYINQLNGKSFNSANGMVSELSVKYNITPQSYLVKFGHYSSDEFPMCSVCKNYVSYLRKHVSDMHDYTKESYVEQFGEPEKWVANTLSNTIRTNSTINNGNSKANTTEQQRKERSPMAIEFYQKKYPDLSHDEQVEIWKRYIANVNTGKNFGENNGNSKANTTEQQRKERSPVAIEFYQKKYPDLSPTEHLQMLNEAKKHISGSIKNHTTRLEYWLEKTGGDIEEAKKLLKKRQTTFSLDICVSKLGYDAGVIRHTNRQIQWNGSIKSNLKCGYSKVSNKFFNDILSHYKEEDKQYVYFNGHNGEYTVKDEITGKTYRLDFYDSKNNFVIEFQGDIYHGNPAIFAPDSYPHPFHKNQAGWTAADIWRRDAIKKDISKNALPGVKYLQLWESKYREDSSFCLDKVIKLIS